MSVCVEAESASVCLCVCVCGGEHSLFAISTCAIVVFISFVVFESKTKRLASIFLFLSLSLILVVFCFSLFSLYIYLYAQIPICVYFCFSCFWLFSSKETSKPREKKFLTSNEGIFVVYIYIRKAFGQDAIFAFIFSFRFVLLCFYC